MRLKSHSAGLSPYGPDMHQRARTTPRERFTLFCLGAASAFTVGAVCLLVFWLLGAFR